MSQPKPQPMKYDELVLDIKRGYLKIPQFQRDFVWEIEQTAQLLDSIIKNYPIGTFIFWKTRERLRAVKNIGSADLPPVPEGDAVQYILDGQQRIASLYASLEGLQVPRENKILDFKKIYIDLDKDVDTDDQIVVSEIPVDGNWITVHDLLSHKGISYFVDNFDRNCIEKIEIYRHRFQTYDFSTILVPEVSVDVAAEIFTRINTSGTPLSLFQIMVAKTYDEKMNFDLQEKYNELQEELESVRYDTIPDSTVLQCLSANIVKECTRKAILRLDKNSVIDTWDETVESIKGAIDYFRTFYHIPVSRILPYNALLVPFSCFFFLEKRKPDSNQEKMLQEYFWRSSLSYRFSSGVESKLGQDIARVSQIIDGKKPEYDFKIILNKEYIRNYGFSTGDSYCKAILCLYASFQPRSFNNNSSIILDNSWLKISSSRNYHHFFPEAYLKKKLIENRNVIANITLVDSNLNKREIGANPPSVYMSKFQKTNPDLDKTMKTHLIEDLDEFGVWKNDYDRFLDKRSELIADELQKRIG